MEKYDIPTYFVCRILIVTIFILLAASAKITLFGRLIAVENRQTEKEEQLQAAQKISDNQKSVVSAFKSLKDKNYQEQYNALEHNIKIIPRLSRAPRECIPEKIGSYYGYIPVLGRDLIFVTSVNINGHEVYNIVTKDDSLELYNVCITRNGKIMDDNAVGNVYMYPDYRILPFGGGDDLVHGVLPFSTATLAEIDEEYASNIDFIETAEDIFKYGVTDLNRNGIPEISLLTYAGGAHCCYVARVTELGDEPKVLFARELGHNSPEILDIDKDGIPEILANDWSFAYWNACFYCSPAPNIVYKYDVSRSKYVMDNRFLNIAPPSDKLITEQATGWSWCVEDYDEQSEFIGDEEGCFYSYQYDEAAEKLDLFYDTPWGFGVDLIFSGYPEQAKRYIKLAWDNGEHQDGSLANFADFWRLFGDTMKKSSNYPDLAHTIPDGYWE